MEILEAGNKNPGEPPKVKNSNFFGKAKCKHCGCKFKYDDGEVCTQRNPMADAYYVVCPQCGNKVGVQLVQRLTILIIIAICFVVMTVSVSVISCQTIGKTIKSDCPKCGAHNRSSINAVILLDEDDHIVESKYYESNSKKVYFKETCDKCGNRYVVWVKE